MPYPERKQLYTQIETLRERPLISFFTSLRPSASGSMATDSISEFIKQLNEIPKNETRIDLLIVSLGGDPMVSWRIISMLRERFKTIGVLLPFAAFSAATLLALGADEIIMHPFSNLGPVDPQLSYERRVPGQPNQTERVNFGAEDLRHFMDYMRSDVGITDQEQMEKAFELVCKDVGAIQIGISKRSSYLALSVGEKLLSLHMKDPNKVKTIAEALYKSFYHHGYPLGRNEAKSIGLQVKEPPEDLEKLMWQVWEDIEVEMECRKPFSQLDIILNDPRAAHLLDPVPQVQIPSNLPQNVMDQVINKILQGINVIQIEPIEYKIFYAAVESNRGRSAFEAKKKILACRLPDMNIAYNDILISQGYNFYKD
jgi:hypothetical protein